MGLFISIVIGKRSTAGISESVFGDLSALDHGAREECGAAAQFFFFHIINLKTCSGIVLCGVPCSWRLFQNIVLSFRFVVLYRPFLSASDILGNGSAVNCLRTVRFIFILCKRHDARLLPDRLWF